jgi:hypothetical protein
VRSREKKMKTSVENHPKIPILTDCRVHSFPPKKKKAYQSLQINSNSTGPNPKQECRIQALQGRHHQREKKNKTERLKINRLAHLRAAQEGEKKIFDFRPAGRPGPRSLRSPVRPYNCKSKWPIREGQQAG